MPLNYRKNNVNYTIEYYSDVNDLNYSGLNASKVNIRVNNVTNYIGLVSSAHEQASDLSVRVNNTNLRLAKKSFAPPTGLSYNGGQTAIPLTSSSISYSPTLTIGRKITYSVSPSLPSGLSLNTSTGIISGTTPANSNDTTYTITATNSEGSTTASFRIRIVYVNTTFTNVDFTNSQISTLSTGYSTRLNGLTSTIANRNFRGSLINGLFWLTYYGNTFWFYFGFEVSSTSFPDTDTGFFKKITLGNNEVLRSRSHQFSNSNGYTSWSFEVGGGSGTRQAFPFPVPQNGQTQTLIIE